jgi:hypothetical protein
MQYFSLHAKMRISSHAPRGKQQITGPLVTPELWVLRMEFASYCPYGTEIFGNMMDTWATHTIAKHDHPSSSNKNIIQTKPIGIQY